MSLEDDILARITPQAAQRQAMAAASAALCAEADAALTQGGWPGRASVQGSVAKDTWLAGATDVDCFLLFDPSVPEADLPRAVAAVGRRVLLDPKQKYAQHPYLIGEFRGLRVDLVPAYAVASPSARMSPVDRTPFHTAWVREHLDDDARGQVRLAKAWCRGVGVYGAETSVGGLSGYLVEVLVHHLGSFAALRDWFAADCQPRRIAPAGRDEVQDDVSPLIVVDPVDAARNCAAAVTAQTIAHAGAAARAYARAPSERFFQPAPPRAEDAAALHAALAGQAAVWMGILMAPRTDRLDLVLPQFQRAARLLVHGLERAGFPVRRHAVDVFADGRRVGMQFVAQDVRLPAQRVHEGPPADAPANAKRFRRKWRDHPDAVGGVSEAGGRLVVTLSVRDRTPAMWLRRHLTGIITAKHVRAAMQQECTILEDPADAPAAWAPAVADLVLDRPPWER